MQRLKAKSSLRCVGVICLIMYVGLYAALSRRGYAEADSYQMEGFYYFTPEETEQWRFRNLVCVYLFWPINVVDRALGLGRCPAFPPLYGLS
jgi:hypothetical protein